MSNKASSLLREYPSPSSPLEFQFLSDTSQRDKTWDDHRGFADAFSLALSDAGLDRPRDRVRDCAAALLFAMKPDATTAELVLKLHKANFCHYRHCPVCQWRRSLKHKAQFLQAIPAVEAQFPQARWLMLTLTVRNCSVSDLRETISSMNKAWKALTKRDEFKAVEGWIRSVEVTRGKDGSAHPHFHALLMVPPAYFGRGFVRTARWSQVWGECLKADYVPVCDARAIKPKMVKGEDGGELVQSKSPLHAAAAEVLKYATKGSDLLAGGADWLAEFIKQVHGLKFLTSGGALKGIFKDKKREEEEDLVHVGNGEDNEAEELATLRFDWRRKMKRYARKRGQ